MHSVAFFNKEIVMAIGGGGGGTTYTYTIIVVPNGCKQYQEGQELRLTFPGTPPQTIVLNYGGACDGVVAEYTS